MTTSLRVRRCPARRRTTWWWSARGTPACGRRTTCAGRTRLSGSRCSSRRWPGSAPPDATAAGAARSSPPRGTCWRGSRLPAEALRLHRAMQETSPRDRPGDRGRGHRRPVPARRHDHAGPLAGAAVAGCAMTSPRRTRAASPRPTSGCSTPDEAAGDARGRRRPGRVVHAALRDGAPRSPGAGARACGRGLRRRHLRADHGAQHPARPGGDRRRHGARRGRPASDGGLHAAAARAIAERSRRSTP